MPGRFTVTAFAGILSALFVSLTTISAVSQAEPYFYSSETELEQHYNHSIQAFWQQQVKQGRFNGQDQVPIAYATAVHPEPVGSIVISSGRIEGYLKYKEVIYELFNNGYSVFIHDHRGQGLSGRMTANPHKGYVRDYANYVADMKTFYKQVVEPNSHHLPLLLGHSMGGAIGVLYLLQYPQDFSRAAMTAPMFGINSPLPDGISRKLVSAGTRLNQWLSELPWYFPGQTNYHPLPFTKNLLTHSEVRYRIFRREYKQTPELQLGGVTFGWLKASIEAMDRIETQLPTLERSLLVLQAGNDKVVNNERQQRICSTVEACRFESIDGARHELLMESDEYRKPAIKRILDFFHQT
ncbi:Lysophospholipase [Saliniradius amylolyticus]|uniref:Lysophospholipase n=1 Tax=Saliniradius amylolyticus TaxID=2183582 RepID=A0A2S2E6C3_9ALTE|nr:alpha/beta fold hydrolase [Saliniradius amylolyticus]AWL13215.1 Lysophospholipase [Saliniradius amylolyticus]